MKTRLMVLAAAFCLVGVAWGAELPDATNEIARCRTVSDATARLECYDRLAVKLDPPAYQEEQDIVARIVAMTHSPSGKLVFELDNGQVWNETSSDGRSRITTGDKVTIQPAAMGSYLMSGPTGRAIRVRRAR